METRRLRAHLGPVAGLEPALVTAGDDMRNLARFLPLGQSTYSATDVVRYLLGEG